MEGEISGETVRRFKAAFIQSCGPPYGIQHLGKAWETVNGPRSYLTDAKVEAHLRGEYYIGPSGRTYDRSVTVDVDAHDISSKTDVMDRTDAVIAAIPDTKPMVFLTPRGGTHVKWLLPQSTWADQARAFVN